MSLRRPPVVLRSGRYTDWVRNLSTALVILLGLAGPARADDPKPLTLGTIHVQAWMEKPSMPPIVLTRGPLQQILDGLQPESARPGAATWELEITRHRQLLRAAEVALVELQRHYEHQMAVHPEQADAFRERMLDERTRMQAQLEREETGRLTRLRARESVLLPQLQHLSRPRRGAGHAASQLLLAEIQLARHQDTFRVLERRWARERRALEAGVTGRAPTRPVPFLGPVIKALERVGDLAPDRLTRERAAQLLAIVHVHNRDPGSATKTLTAVLKSNVSWQLEAELLNRLGDLLLQAGRFAGAATVYGRVKKVAGSWHVRAELGQAWCRYRLTNAAGALQAVRSVRGALEGLFDRSAHAVLAEADRLYAQLLADRAGPLPSQLSPRLRDAVLGLRRRGAIASQPNQVVAGDGRRRAVASRIPALRRCYRTYLRSAPGQSVHVLLALRASKRPQIVTASAGDATMRACLNRALRPVETLPDDQPAVLALEFDQ